MALPAPERLMAEMWGRLTSTASDDPANAATRVSVVSSIGYIAFLAGPPLLGMLADQVGYRYAPLTITVPLVASLILSPVAAPLSATQDDISGT